MRRKNSHAMFMCIVSPLIWPLRDSALSKVMFSGALPISWTLSRIISLKNSLINSRLVGGLPDAISSTTIFTIDLHTRKSTVFGVYRSIRAWQTLISKQISFSQSSRRLLIVESSCSELIERYSRSSKMACVVCCGPGTCNNIAIEVIDFCMSTRLFSTSWIHDSSTCGSDSMIFPFFEGSNKA